MTRSRTGLASIWRLTLSIALLAVLALAAPPPQVAHAATINVTTTDDELTSDGDCSLREAIEAANTNAVVDNCTAGSGWDTINLPAGTYTLSLTGTGEDANQTGDLDVTDDLTIIGADQTTTIIDGDGIDRVFHIAPSETILFEMSHVTIANGNAGDNSGGGILNSLGAVTLEYCTITGNSAGGVGEGLLLMAGGGGGIYNYAGSLSLTNCTVSYNLASDDDAGMPPLGALGGGILNVLGTVSLTDSSLVHNSANGFGGIANLAGDASLSRCTIALNSAAGSYYSYGGGLGVGGMGELYAPTLDLTNCTVTLNAGGGLIALGTSTTTLTNCTVSHNSGVLFGPGGISNTSAESTVSLKNTIVANSTTGEECNGTMTSLGYNLASDDTCDLTGTGDQPDTDPLLGPLQDNGGPTLTRALLAGSPAIDAADNVGCPSTDQRGEPRPEDGDGDLSAVCDIGAYEAAGLPPFSEITIQKSTNGYDADSPPGPYIPVDDAVSWTYEVSNTGDTVLSGIYVTDNQGVAVTCPEASLDPDESMTCTASGTAQIGEYSNTATVYGTPSVGETVSDSDTSHYFGTSPAIDIEKATNGQDADGAPGPEIAIGEPVNWTYEVVNRGNVPLTGITVQDDQGAVVDCPHTALGPAEFMTCTASGVAELGQYENLGSVTGYYGTTQVTDSDASHYLGVTRADLAITKTSEPVTAYPGDQITYGIRVTNLGPSEALDVTVTDVLPPAVDYELDTGSCIEGPAGTLTCSLGNLAAGESSDFEVYVRVPPEAPVTTIANTATVASTEPPDPDEENNSATANTVVLGKADLSIHKLGKPDGEVQAGEELTYTVIVDNLGPGLAHSVVVSDVLQSSGSFDLVSVISDRPASCSPAPGGTHSERLELTCGLNEDLEVMTPDTPGRWILTIVVQANEAQSINNVARVTSSDLDPDLSNNEAIVEHEITEGADLSVIKMSKPDDLVQAGESFVYTIFVDNLGPSYAQGVQIDDDILSSGTFTIDGIITDPGRNDACGVPPGTTRVECQLLQALEPVGEDPPTGAQSGRWIVKVRLIADETQDVNNIARVFTGPIAGFFESGTPDPDMSNNQAQDSIHVGDAADLSLVKTVFPPPSPPFYAGNNVRFRLRVTNNGPSTAENVVLEDTLPVGVRVVNLTSSQGSCTTGDPGTTPLTCYLGTIGDGASATVLVLLNIHPDYMGTLENDAVVSGDIFDPNNGNNSAHAVVNVSTWSNVFLKKGCGWEEEVPAGQPLQYDIVIRNDGPSTVHNFELWDLLPDDVTFLSYEMLPSGGGECHFTPQLPPMHGGPGQGLHCYLGDIRPGVTRIIYVRARVHPDAPEGYMYNEVTDWDGESNVYFTSWPEDWYCSNYVIDEADLSVRKDADPWKVYAGEQVRYDIAVTNNGPAVASNVLVSDTLPAEVEFEVVTDAACEEEDGVVTCTWDAIAVGQTMDFSIFARVLPDAPAGVISNEVTVSSGSSDPIDYNDRDTAPSNVLGKADLKIQKFGKPDGQVYAAEELTYTVIVDNLGPGYAHDVVLKDVLKSSGTFDLVSVSSDRDALCTPEPGSFTQSLELTCSLTDTLDVMSPEPGAGRWTITVVVQADERQDINNVARVVGSDLDPDPSNNEAIAEHEITAVADLELLKLVLGEVPSGCEGALELREDEVAAGATMTYTLQVTNLGPSTAVNVEIQDPQLPPLVEIQSVTPSQGTCNTGPEGNQLVCGLGDLASGASAIVDVKASVPPWVVDGTIIRNDARVFSDIYDDNNSNNLPTNWTTITRWSDLEVKKTQDPEISLPGWDVTYTITVTNLGLSDAEGAIISDTVPVQVLNPTWTCCASDEGECDIPCEPPACPEEPCPWPDIGLYAQADIPAGEWVIYTVEGTLDWWPCGPFTNTVEVIAPQSLVHPETDVDPCDENNVTFDVNDPMCHYDPLVLKSFPGPDSTP